MEEAKNVHDQVLECCRYLAGVCDGAVQLDNQGFNAFDASFGHSLASQTSLSENQVMIGAKMLTKYKGQLERAGYTVPQNEEVKKYYTKNKKPLAVKIDLRTGRTFVEFSYKPPFEIRNAMKQIPGWRFEAEVKKLPWSFPLDKTDAVLDLFPNATVADNVKNWKEQIPDLDLHPTKMTVNAEGDFLFVYFPNKPSPEELDKVKGIPGRRWEPDLPYMPWKIPLPLYPEVQAIFPNAHYTDKFIPATEKLQQLKTLSRAQEADLIIEGLNEEHGEIRPYQKAAVKFLQLRNGCAMIADEQGLGKSLESLAFLQSRPDLRPALIVCPSSVKINWSREVNKWTTTNNSFEILQGQKPYATTGEILIINWEILTHWAEHIRTEIKPKVVIGDETQYMKTTGTKRTDAMIKIVAGKEKVNKRWKQTSDPVKYFIPMTGTPITNRPMDFFTTLNLLEPALFGNRHKFGLDFCGAYHNGFGWQYTGSSNQDVLHDVIKGFVIRRLKKDVLTELPDKVYIPLPLEIDNREKYIRAEEAARRRIEQMRKRHIPTGAEHLKLMTELKQITAEGKLGEMVNWIRDTIENEKLLVFCHHHKIMDVLLNAFADTAVEISGRVPVGKKRTANEDRFMNDPDCKLCVAQIHAGGVGLNLTAASKVLFVEFPWNPKDIDQADSRVHRMGQKADSVMVYFATGVNTIEEHIVKVLIDKAKDIDEIMDGKTIQNLSVIEEVMYKLTENQPLLF